MRDPKIDLRDPKYHAIRNFRIIEFVDKGKRGNVFKVVDPNNGGAVYALKVVRGETKQQLSESLNSFTSESKKAATYKELGVAHSAIIQSHPSFIVKEWIEGMRGDEWVRQWSDERTPYDSMIASELRQLVRGLAKKGAYIGDLNAKNLIWIPPLEGQVPPFAPTIDGGAVVPAKKGWVIVDSGSTITRLSFREAMARYVANIPRKWGKHADERTVRKLERLLRKSQ